MERYEAYKDSGVEWIGVIPVGWKVSKIKYLTTIKGGYAFKSESFSNDGIPVVRIGDISETIDWDKCKKVTKENNVPNEFCINQFNILIALSGATTGKVCFIANRPPKAYLNQRVAKISYRNKFLFYVFSSSFIQEQIWLTAAGSAQENISNAQIGDFEIATPNDSEQTVIANYLDRKTAEIDALIAQKERLLELYEEEKTAIINHAVTKGIDPNAELKDSGIEWLGEIPVRWEIKKLKYLLDESLKYGANESALLENREHPRYIRITDFGRNGKLREETFKSLPPEIASDYILENGDILFARSGATVGKTFQFKNYDGSACFAGYLIKASPNAELIMSDFLYAFTKSSYYEKWKESILNQATIQNIGADKYAMLDVPLPPNMEQIAIANFLDHKTAEIDAKIAKTQRIIKLQKEYRTALISEVVTGKIKVSHLAEEEVAQ